MNWLEIGGYYFNLDNIVFLNEVKEEIKVNAEGTTYTEPCDKTMIGFIGGQSINVPLPKQTVVCMIIEHHRKLGFGDVSTNNKEE